MTSNPQEQPLYRELQKALSPIRGELVALINTFSDLKVPASQLPNIPDLPFFTSEVGISLIETHYDTLLKAVPQKERKIAATNCDSRKERIISSLAEFDSLKIKIFAAVAASFVGARVALGGQLEKGNATIQPLMNAVQNEEAVLFQRRAAHSIATLIPLLSQGPGEKVVSKICAAACSQLVSTTLSREHNQLEGILTFREDLLQGDSKGEAGILAGEESSPQSLARRGALFCLEALAKQLGDKLFQQIPVLWTIINGPLQKENSCEGFDGKVAADEGGLLVRDIVSGLQILADLVPFADPALHGQLAALQAKICTLLGVRSAVIRNVAGKTIGAMAAVLTRETLENLISLVIPLLESPRVSSRQGAAEAIYCSALDTSHPLSFPRLDIFLFLFLFFFSFRRDP